MTFGVAFIFACIESWISRRGAVRGIKKAEEVVTVDDGRRAVGVVVALCKSGAATAAVAAAAVLG